MRIYTSKNIKAAINIYISVLIGQGYSFYGYITVNISFILLKIMMFSNGYLYSLALSVAFVRVCLPVFSTLSTSCYTRAGTPPHAASFNLQSPGIIIGGKIYGYVIADYWYTFQTIVTSVQSNRTCNSK